MRHGPRHVYQPGDRDWCPRRRWALEPNQRLVFLISEAEVLCDMEGIDSFLDRYAAEWLGESADAFAAVGATEIAAGLRAIARTGADALVVGQTNTLIAQRVGYDYDASAG